MLLKGGRCGSSDPQIAHVQLQCCSGSFKSRQDAQERRFAVAAQTDTHLKSPMQYPIDTGQGVDSPAANHRLVADILQADLRVPCMVVDAPV
jgi:hypothetical protein